MELIDICLAIFHEVPNVMVVAKDNFSHSVEEMATRTADILHVFYKTRDSLSLPYF